MNNRAPYEQLIAQKFEQLPVPDMADEIWAAIETDPGMPGAAGTGKGSGGHNNWLGLGVSALVVVAILLWVLLHNKQTIQKGEFLPDTIPATEKEYQPTDSNTNKNLKEKESKITIAPVDNTKDTVQHTNTGTITDSLHRIQAPLIFPDSITIDKRNIFLPAIDSALSIPPKEKPKGVKGISDKDYRIESNKKDTGTNKNQ